MVDALAPDLVAVAWVEELVDPVAGVVTCTVVGDDTFGFVVAVTDPVETGGVTFTWVGAFTCGDVPPGT